MNGFARAERVRAGRMEVDGPGEMSRLGLMGENGLEVVTVASVLTARDL